MCAAKLRTKIGSTKFIFRAAREKRENPIALRSDTLEKIYQISPAPHPDITPQAAVIYQIYRFRRRREKKTNPSRSAAIP
jgi:hypothetical protein